MRPPSDTTAPAFDFFADFMGPRDPDEPQPSFSFNFGPRAPQRRLAETFELYPEIGTLLPAMGYGETQMRELQETLNATPADVIVAGTPANRCM